MSNKRYRRPAPSQPKAPIVPLFVAQELAVLDEQIEMYGKMIKLHRFELQFRLNAIEAGEVMQPRWQVSPSMADRAARRRDKLLARRAELIAPPTDGPTVEEVTQTEESKGVIATIDEKDGTAPILLNSFSNFADRPHAAETGRADKIAGPARVT